MWRLAIHWVGLFLLAFSIHAEDVTPIDVARDPVGISKYVAAELRSKKMTAAQCSDFIARVGHDFMAVRPGDFGARLLSTSQPMGPNHPSIWIPETSRNLQAAKMALFEQLRRHYEKDPAAVGPLAPYRRLHRVLRYADESLTYLNRFVLQEKPNEPLTEVYFNPALDLGPTIIHPENYFKPGDLVLTRSIRSLSSVIARMPEDKDVEDGDMDSQFSHIEMIAADPSGKLVTLGAHIETGVTISSMESFLARKLARFSVYRFNDKDIAKSAADIGYYMIKGREVAGLPAIRYNFKGTINDKDDELSDGMFCSGMARTFYSIGAGRIQKTDPCIPTFQGSYNLRNPWILEKFGIPPGQPTFVPGDLEIDPRFQFVMEWRNLEGGYTTSLNDVISTELFSRLDQGYRFQSDLMAKVTREVLLRIRKMPEPLWAWIPKLGSGMKKSFPAYIPPDALEVMTMVVRVSDHLEAELLKRDREFIRTHGQPMGWTELQVEVRKILDEDAAQSGWISQRFSKSH